MRLISLCEKQFVSNCVIKRQKRLDGRKLSEGRTLEIVFSHERGCCIVLLGNTRVLAQVTCDVTEPKAVTPTEGAFHVNFELSAMAGPDVKYQSRSSEESVEVQRILERCIRDSKCIDLESLCIVAGSKVWTIRLDLHTLNDDGNLIECANIAAIAALAHFRRPDVTVVGRDVTVHSVDEREPVPLNLHHMPISINLALFNQGKFILVDPTELEERICDGCYMIGMNAHQEVCFVHRRGVLLLKENAIEKCENVALKRSQQVTQVIRAALDDDAYKRNTNAPIGFISLIQTSTILGAKRPLIEINLETVLDENNEPEVANIENEDIKSGDDKPTLSTAKVKPSSVKERVQRIFQDLETAVFEGGPSKWCLEENNGESSDEIASDSELNISSVKKENDLNTSSVKEEINLDSEEEETVYVNKDQVDIKPTGTRKWYTKDLF